MDLPNVSGAATASSQAVSAQPAQTVSSNAARAEVLPTVPAETYSSPTLAIDSVTGSVIIEYRSTTSGEEVSQIPSRATLEYQQTQKLAAEKSDSVKPGESQG
ncbi:hypothetical protein [Telmatospirillum sp.]|uniref:hypothetical protein n=1 Tax=Telmatospirillum sp. TaxID=2079197 RepID=UPI00284AECDD|nr:hypothetical protein [Telmatospirillum sp.]MDR3437656.1 hypothetical protein [Telmatospirillum sp.]